MTTTKKKKVNRIAIVLDNSPSMTAFRKDCVAAFNANVDTIVTQARKTRQRTAVSLFVFGGSNQIDTRYLNVTVGEITKLDLNSYRADGNGTALWDATAHAINKLNAMSVDPNEDVSNLLIVLTDGEDNSSQKYVASSWRPGLGLRELIEHVQQTGRWTLAFSVPQGAKYDLVRHLNVPHGNVQEWEQTTRGFQDYSANTSKGTMSFYAARSVGATSVDNFYTDLSGVKASAVKKILTDLTNEVKSYTVSAEERIREFVEAKTKRPLLRGAAFYQLTKSEKKVQKGKQILVMEKGKSTIYGGPEARDLLGLPDADVKVIPGNHANFDIFVQSTSTNRVLVRGTKVLYWAAIGVPYKEGPSMSTSAQAKSNAVLKSNSNYFRFWK